MAILYAGRHQGETVSRSADQTEIEAILQTAVTVDAGIRDEIISGELDDLETGLETKELDWSLRDVKQEQLSGEVLEELQRRAGLLGQAWPFALEGGQIVHRPSRTRMYEFLLSVSMARSITTGNYVELPRLFERVVTTLVGWYMGHDAEAYHVGVPRDEEVGTSFREAMGKLALGQSEWFWQPQSDLDVDPTYRDTKDEGLDFVIIKKMLDGRPGRFYLFGQCACGNNWSEKTHEPALPDLQKWFNPAWLVQPAKAIAIPFLLTDAIMLATARSSGLLVFDRVRLTTLAESPGAADAVAPYLARIAEAQKIALES